MSNPYKIDRCHVCRTTVDLDWSADVCEHDTVTCASCDPAEVCDECHAATLPDWEDALATSVAEVAAIRAEHSPRVPLPEPVRRDPGDLTIGSLSLGLNGLTLKRCRVCLKAIHVGAPYAVHTPSPGASSISYYFHPDCLPEGTLPHV